MKFCPRCTQTKSLDEFYSNGRQGYCKSCSNAYKRDTYDRVKRRAREMKLQYNLDYDDYLKMSASGCAICGRTDINLVIDHDHLCCPERKKSCGKCIRGLLCSNHNVLLGMATDSVETLKLAIKYLEGVK